MKVAYSGSNKGDLTVDVNVAKIPGDVNDPSTTLGSIVYLGLRNRLMDAHASVTADEYPNDAERAKAAEAKSLKVLDALYAGEVRTVGTREGDPIKAEARRLAVKAIEAKARKAKKKIDRKDVTAAANAIYERFMAQAKINVEAAAKAINETDFDLDDILAA